VGPPATALVLDNSVLVGWFVPEQADGYTRRIAQRARRVDLIVPALREVEFANVLALLLRRFGIPVAAVIDARAMAQTFGALAQGLAHYGDVPFAGVIANRVAGEGHVAMLRESLAPDIPLLASLGADAERDHHNIKSGDHSHLQGGLIEDADPAHTQTLGPGGQPQILHGADAAIQVHGLHVGASDHHRAGALAVQFLLSLRRHQPWEINSNCSKPKP